MGLGDGAEGVQGCLGLASGDALAGEGDALGWGGHLASNEEERGRVENDEVLDGVRRREFAREEGSEHCCVLCRLPAANGGEGVEGQAKVGRRDRRRGDHAVGELPALRQSNIRRESASVKRLSHVARLACVGPAGLISSKPSAPHTTHALSTPVSLSASAKIGPKYGECTPTIIAFGFAGLMRGPRALKTVGKAIALRTGATRTMAGW